MMKRQIQKILTVSILGAIVSVYDLRGASKDERGFFSKMNGLAKETWQRISSTKKGRERRAQIALHAQAQIALHAQVKTAFEECPLPSPLRALAVGYIGFEPYKVITMPIMRDLYLSQAASLRIVGDSLLVNNPHGMTACFQVPSGICISTCPNSDPMRCPLVPLDRAWIAQALINDQITTEDGKWRFEVDEFAAADLVPYGLGQEEKGFVFQRSSSFRTNIRMLRNQGLEIEEIIFPAKK